MNEISLIINSGFDWSSKQTETRIKQLPRMLMNYVINQANQSNQISVSFQQMNFKNWRHSIQEMNLAESTEFDGLAWFYYNSIPFIDHIFLKGYHPSINQHLITVITYQSMIEIPH